MRITGVDIPVREMQRDREHVLTHCASHVVDYQSAEISLLRVSQDLRRCLTFIQRGSALRNDYAQRCTHLFPIHHCYVFSLLLFNIQRRDKELFLPLSTQWRLKGINLIKGIHANIIFLIFLTLSLLTVWDRWMSETHRNTPKGINDDVSWV